MKIGFIGLGAMGRPMAESLQRAGHELASDAKVPMKVGRIAFEELDEAMKRGWSERDCRVAMTLQEERAAVSVRVPRERLENLPD